MSFVVACDLHVQRCCVFLWKLLQICYTFFQLLALKTQVMPGRSRNTSAICVGHSSVSAQHLDFCRCESLASLERNFVSSIIPLSVRSRSEKVLLTFTLLRCVNINNPAPSIYMQTPFCTAPPFGWIVTQYNFIVFLKRMAFFRKSFSIFLLQRNLPQIFALLMEPYAMVQVSAYFL